MAGVAGEALLRTAERDALDAAEEFLTFGACTSRPPSGRTGSRSSYSRRSRARWDSPTSPGGSAEDALMRAVFEHARAVRWVSDNVLARGETGVSMPTDPPVPFRDTDDALDALASIAEAGGLPDARLLDSIEVTRTSEPIEWTTRPREAFLRILQSGEAGVQPWTRWTVSVSCRACCRPGARCGADPSATRTIRSAVDVHLTTALAEMGRLLTTADADHPDGCRALATPLIETGCCSALLHDIGKTGEGGHVPVGTRVTTEVLDHMRIRGTTRELAAFMVAEHLLLPDTATRRDLTDENLVLDVAAGWAHPSGSPLTLLAEADAAATGPAAWTPWRQT